MRFIQKILEKGGEVYEVGGGLRDELLGLPKKDHDLLVSHLAMRDLIPLLEEEGSVQKVGKSFGVLKFRPRGSAQEFDLALPRLERSTGVGHRDFEVVYDPFIPLEKDLARRDFTINAMARSFRDQTLFDPFCGRKDLHQKVLRQVFPKAFEEDPLRILRGIQFAARFELAIEPDTLRAMHEHAKLIQTVSSERITQELAKLFLAKKPSQGFRWMTQIGIFPLIFPELASIAEDPVVFERICFKADACRSDSRLKNSGDAALIFMALFSTFLEFYSFDQTQKLVCEWMRQYHLTMLGIQARPVAKTLSLLARKFDWACPQTQIRRLLHEEGKKVFFYFLDLALVEELSRPSQGLEPILRFRERVENELAKNPPLCLQELAISGEDLKEMGVPAGPLLGEILEELMDEVLEDPAKNQAVTLMESVRRKFFPLAHLK